MSTILALLAAIIVSSAAFWCHFFRNPGRQPIAASCPPGLGGCRSSGTSPSSAQTSTGSLWTWPYPSAPYTRSPYIGTRLYVIISSPSLAKEVVRDHDMVFANRNPNIAALAFSYGGNDIAFLPYGPLWRKLRRLFVTEMQSSANLDAFYNLRRNEVAKCMENVREMAGTPVDVGELAFTTIVNMVSGMFWGRTLEPGQAVRLGGEFRSAVLQLTTVLGKPNVSDFFPLLARFDLGRVERDMREVSSWLGRIFDFVIARREELNQRKERDGCENTRDFLQFLMEYKDAEDSGRPISKDQIKALLMDIVVGGTDTTSTTVDWCMTEILLHPKVLWHIHDELNDVVGIANDVEEWHINRLPYLHAVVKEAMRLHPVAPLLLPRSPARSCTVGGFTIPEGCKVFLNVWAMHRDPQFWDDPSEFWPERFLGTGKPSYSGDTMYYMPFGSERRICAGMRLGERMLMHVLASLLHRFDWEVPEGAELDSREKFGVVLEKATPLVAIPAVRSPSGILKSDAAAGCY